MTGDTHSAGGVLFSVLGFIILKENNLLLPDVNPLLQLVLIHPFCVWGSTVSDLDHHWESCPDKSDVNRVINKALHLTSKSYHHLDEKLTKAQKRKSMRYKIVKFFNASHRSWQTHSELTLLSLILLLYCIISGKFFTGGTDIAISTLMMTGITLGVFSHLVLDMFTSRGINFCLGILINKIVQKLTKQRDLKVVIEKLRFVPNSGRFATDSAWESFIYKVLRLLTYLSVLYIIVGLVFPDLIPILVNSFPYSISFK